jgi:hypothetical protein
MSPIAIFGVVWLSLGLIAVAIAAWKKLNVVPWVFFGPILGLFAIYLVLLQVAGKSRAGRWSADGSTYYGGGVYGGGYGAGGIGFTGGHHGGACGHHGGSVGHHGGSGFC